MALTRAGQEADRQHRNLRHSGSFILGGLSSGHGIFHWINTSFTVMGPEVRASFGISNLQVGAISSTREFAGGLISLPGGIVTDMLQRYWGVVLAICMAVFGIGWLVMGLAPLYPMLLVGMAMVAISSSVWHLPGVAALSLHFADRRGAALSIHGIGGSIGDVLGPLLTGVLLGAMTWRGILGVYAAVPLFLTFLVFWSFRDIGRGSDGASKRPDLQAQMAESRLLLKNKRLWGITLVAGLRGMAFVTMTTFLPLYLEDVAELSEWWRAAYIALMMAVGIVFTPVMGYLSDRMGRKLVLVPGMIFLAALSLLLALFGEGDALPVIVAALGIFLYSDQPILTAAALDVVGASVAGTMLGVLSFSRFALAAASPLIAGAMYDADTAFPFFYVAGLFALATAILLAVPLGTGSQTADSLPAGRQGDDAAR